MTYIIEHLGSVGGLGAIGADARALVADASPGAIPLKMMLADNVKAQPSLTRYQHFNLIRFNKAIKDGSDSELKRRMDKGDYEQYYKAWRAMIREPLKNLRSGSPGKKAQSDDKRPKWSNNELNSLLYDEFKKWYREAKRNAPASSTPPPAEPDNDSDNSTGGESESGGGGSGGGGGNGADKASTSTNTMLYVGIGVALLAVFMIGAQKSKQ